MANTTTAKLTQELAALDWPAEVYEWHPTQGREFERMMQEEAKRQREHARFMDRSERGSKAYAEALFCEHVADGTERNRQLTYAEGAGLRHGASIALEIGYLLRDQIPDAWKEAARANFATIKPEAAQ